MVCKTMDGLVLVILFGCVYAQWSGGLNANYDHLDRYGRLRASLEYQRDRTSFSGSGWVDTNRNWGVGLKFTHRFRRAFDSVKPNLHLLIQVNPCQFGVYDSNMNGVITRDEIQAVFAEDGHLAEALFGAMDSIKGDGLVTPEVFNFLAPKIIYGCGPVGDIVTGDVNNQDQAGSEVDASRQIESRSKNEQTENVLAV